MLLVMREKPTLEPGSPVSVKINGEITPATYVGWSDKYNLPIVAVGGRKMYRKIIERVNVVAAAKPSKKNIPLEDRLPQPIEIESTRPSLLSMNRTRIKPLTRLRENDIVDYYGVRAKVVRVSDCSADLEMPRQPREITTRDGDTRTIVGGARIERISPNSELPILNR